MAKMKEFYSQCKNNAFAKDLSAKNLMGDKSPVEKELFWEVMISCLLTSQQRSGP
jgi:hypothetical protein